MQSYPTTLPAPADFRFSPRERRRAAVSNDGAPVVRRFAIDAVMDGELRWRFNAEQLATFDEWFASDLALGARWFLIDLPGRGGVISRAARFIGPPRVVHVQTGVFDVSATLEIRTTGTSVPYVAPGGGGCRERPAKAVWDSGGGDPYNPVAIGNTSQQNLLDDALLLQFAGAFTVANFALHQYASGGQIGIFSNGGGVLGIERGIAVCTGLLHHIGTTVNNTTIGDELGGTVQDGSLATIDAGTQHDMARLSFDFTPLADGVLRFKFVMASEEYDYESPYNDIVGIFVDGTNVAVLPGTGTPISPATVNKTTNAAYLINNDLEEFGYPNMPFPKFLFDGFTTPIVSEAIAVSANTTYAIKIAVADLNDNSINSALFIEEGAFTTNDQCED